MKRIRIIALGLVFALFLSMLPAQAVSDGLEQVFEGIESSFKQTGEDEIVVYERRNPQDDTAVQMEEHMLNGLDFEDTTDYEYDANNRLLSTVKTNTNTGETETVTDTYNYDPNGNQVSHIRETLSQTPPAPAPTLGFGGDFELSMYDGFNRLVAVISDGQRTEYDYNPNGLRAETTKTIMGSTGSETVTTTYIWDGANIVAERTGNNVTKYVRGINLIYSESAAGTSSRRYYLYNAHGDVVQLTDTSGNVAKTYYFDSFGNERNPDPNDTNPFRFAGEFFDKETGNYYHRARYYDPVLGRFTQQDTIWFATEKLLSGQEVIDPLSLNLYTYCYNNPVNSWDPSGHIAIELGVVYLVAASGALIATTIEFLNSPAGQRMITEGYVAIYNGVVIAGKAVTDAANAVVDGVVAGATWVWDNGIAPAANWIGNAATDAWNWATGLFSDKSLDNARSLMAFASTTATPPPPNNPHSRGTRTTSTTLYNKNGIHVDVENPGYRPGQVHIQTGGVKYYYDIANQTLRIGSSSGKIAPNSVLKLLNNPDIIKAIAKGLGYLGY